MSDRWYYICDHCGSIVNITDAPIPEDENWECADCGSSAMWAFTDARNAMAHAEHIRGLVRSGLVRRLPRG
jgi:DNA-directed RNA polymerase subunit RPC12/RpoP